MTNLLQTLQSADAPSRELDAEIAYALGWKDDMQYVPGHGWRHWYIDHDEKTRFGLPTWTSSLDVALALVAEMLPGWTWEYSLGIMRLISPDFLKVYVSSDGDCADSGREPIKMIIALLRALEAEARDG